MIQKSKYCSYALPIDIAERLYFNRQHRARMQRVKVRETPQATLQGVVRAFGTLEFDFGDEVVKLVIYVRDREQILNAAQVAIANFDELVDEFFGLTSLEKIEN